MFILKNPIIAFILIGGLNFLINRYFVKKMKKLPAAYLTFGVLLVFFLPLMTLFVEFDVVFTIYLGSLLVWLIFDLLRSGENL